VLIDISPLISADLAVWPGDVRFSRQVALDLADGANLTLSSMTATLHLGAHTDAPNHYARSGVDIAARPLETYYGRCQVVEVDVELGRRISVSDVRANITAERVLFKTGTYPDPTRFNTDFASLSPELVRWLADQGVVLVGIDTPSIDLFDDKELLSHNAVADCDVAILEGVVLGNVSAGIYRLIALPLPIRGGDASPVRAVLETL
jgi:arylformamidase